MLTKSRMVEIQSRICIILIFLLSLSCLYISEVVGLKNVTHYQMTSFLVFYQSEDRFCDYCARSPCGDGAVCNNVESGMGYSCIFDSEISCTTHLSPADMGEKVKESNEQTISDFTKTNLKIHILKKITDKNFLIINSL